MSMQITTAFVEQYSANVTHLAQQKGSRFRPTGETESVRGKNAFFEQIGPVAAQLRTTRHSPTPQIDTPHLRRRVSLSDYDWADLIDQVDRVKMLIDPTSEYAWAAAQAMGRAMDDVWVTAFLGNANTGVDGSTVVPFDATMTVPVTIADSGVAAGNYGLNVAKLTQAKYLLDKNEVEPEDRYIACNAKQLQSLLGQTRVTSSDYNTVKALVQGELNTFLGFTFIHSERIPQTTAKDTTMFWQRSGMKLAIGMDATARISERADLNYSTQVFYTMTIGATRMEEKRCGYILCEPTGIPGS